MHLHLFKITYIYTKHETYFKGLVIILITWCPPIGWCPRALAQSRLWIIRPWLYDFDSLKITDKRIIWWWFKPQKSSCNYWAQYFLCYHIQFRLPTEVKIYIFCRVDLAAVFKNSHHSKQYKKNWRTVKRIKIIQIKITIFRKINILPSPNYFVVFSGSCQMSTPNGRMKSRSVFPCLLLSLFKTKFTWCVPSSCFTTWGCEELSSACSFSLLKFIWRSLLRLYKHSLLWLHAEFCRPVLFLVFPCCEALEYLHGGLPRALPPSTQESFFMLSCLSTHIFSPFWSEKNESKRSL